MVTLLLIIDHIKDFGNQYGYWLFIPIILGALFISFMVTAGVKHIIIPGAKDLLNIRPEPVGMEGLKNSIPLLMDEFEGLK